MKGEKRENGELNDFQKELLKKIKEVEVSVTAIEDGKEIERKTPILEYEQAEIFGNKIRIAVVDGFVEISIPESEREYIWTRTTVEHGGIDEHALSRANRIAEKLNYLSKGKE